MSTLSLSCTPAQRSPQPLVAQHHHHSRVTVLSGSWPAVFLRLTNKSEVCPQLRGWLVKVISVRTHSSGCHKLWLEDSFPWVSLSASAFWKPPWASAFRIMRLMANQTLMRIDSFIKLQLCARCFPLLEPRRFKVEQDTARGGGPAKGQQGAEPHSGSRGWM